MSFDWPVLFYPDLCPLAGLIGIDVISSGA
jgi:hypothetical protein